MNPIPPDDRKKMKLQDMTKEEILEAIDVLHECDLIDPEGLYTDRDKIVTGEDGDKVWKLCEKYRTPLIHYVYREFIKE